MLEAIVIIAALGGLEVILWFFDYRQQRKQIDLLDSIWAELAIQNSAHEEQTRSSSQQSRENASNIEPVMRSGREERQTR